MQTEQVKNKYNKDVLGKYQGKYEEERWFKNDIQKAGYIMTLNAIRKHALKSKYAACLELGPGHGTWTKELLDFQPEAKYTLVDISRAMINLAQARLGEKENISYVESDFLNFRAESRYDFFFSIRAIEYIPEKGKVIRKISDLLKPGGKGFIITKTPKYLRHKLLGRAVPEFHSGQIAPQALKKMLVQNNCTAIKIYPATLSWPFWRSAQMNLLLYNILGDNELNFVSKFFSESYCVVFEINK